MTFNDLRLSEPIVRAVTDAGYATPTPIQAETIPTILDGSDVLGCARTGTGKTAAFALPILDRIGRRPMKGRRCPRALVVAPTRELATQILDSFRTYGSHVRAASTSIFGGVGQMPQVRALSRGVDILVATPGRLLDLMQQGYVDLSYVEVLVLDEADHMLDMGFIRDIRKIVQAVPEKRQTLLFSATMPAEIRDLASSILTDPVSISVAPVSSTATAVAQNVYMVEKKDKPELLGRLLSAEEMGRTLVFTRTKHGADRLVKMLGRDGIRAAAIHGNKSQNARTRALEGFRAGRTPILIATDIAARGIDVDGITHVINFDIPNVPETYVHRVGRTARAGASGAAISFCDQDEIGDLRAIERLTKIRLDVATDHPDLVADIVEPKPSSRRSKGGGGRRRGTSPNHRGSGESRRGKTQGSSKRSRRRRTAPRS